MAYETPRPVDKQKIDADIAKYESHFTEQRKTLSQFFSDQVLNIWNADELTAAELLIVRENIAQADSTCLILLELDPASLPR